MLTGWGTESYIRSCQGGETFRQIILKGAIYRAHGMMAYMGVEIQLHSFWTLTLNSQLQSLPVLPTPHRYALNRMLSAYRKRASHSAEKMCVPLPGTEPRYLMCPPGGPVTIPNCPEAIYLLHKLWPWLMTITDMGSGLDKYITETEKRPSSKDQYIVLDWREHLWPCSISNVLIIGIVTGRKHKAKVH